MIQFLAGVIVGFISTIFLSVMLANGGDKK